LNKPVKTALGLIFIATLVTPPPQDKDFGSKFFDDLRRLFGRLQQSELDLAFRRANPVRCSELVSQTGEWKQVAFLNDDRKLGDWHHDNIDDVKKDPAKYVFSGSCRGEQGPVKLTTSFPVQETFKKPPLVVRNNDPVSVFFDSATNAYTFQLPYLYLESKEASGSLYTEHPPLLTSKVETDVSEEFRCKALSDPELTYRFLLCRTRVVGRNEATRPQLRKQPQTQPLGNATYQILSDGKEAASSVTLKFGDEVDLKSRVVTTEPPKRAPQSLPARERGWQPASPQAKLVDIGQDEFRLQFNSVTWKDKMSKPQLLINQALSPLSTAPPTSLDREYCAWRPGPVARFDQDSAIFSLGFSKSLKSVTSAIFSIEDLTGARIGTLECRFPRSETPSDVTIQQWQSVVGRHVAIEIRR
jgi:hypothetical protein